MQQIFMCGESGLSGVFGEGRCYLFWLRDFDEEFLYFIKAVIHAIVEIKTGFAVPVRITRSGCPAACFVSFAVHSAIHFCPKE